MENDNQLYCLDGTLISWLSSWKMKCGMLTAFLVENDRANIKSARYFSEHIPSSELKIFDKAGHIINEEEPEWLAMELIRFYDKI